MAICPRGAVGHRRCWSPAIAAAGGTRWSKRAASRIANAIRRRLLGDDTPDTGCGLKLFSRALFLDLPYFDHMHRFLPALVLRGGGEVRSVPVNHRPRQARHLEIRRVRPPWVGIVDLVGVMWLQRRATRRSSWPSRRRPIGAPDGAAGGVRREFAHSTGAAVIAGRTLRDLPAAWLRGSARLLLLALLLVGAAIAWRWRAALDPAALGAEIGRYPAAPLVFLAVHIAASLLFVPRTLLAIAAGLVFGVGWGIVWAAIGSVAGAVAGFLVARYLNAGLIDLARHPTIRPILERVERGGWRAVAVLRLIPVMPHSLANYALGLTRLPLGGYALGSLLGQLPMTIAYVDFGAAGGAGHARRSGWLGPTLIGRRRSRCRC